MVYSFSIPKDTLMPISSTPMTALIALVMMIFLQALPDTPQVQNIEQGAGLYALLFIVFKEIAGLIKWFKKDPVATNNQLINNLTVTVSEFISKMTELEETRTNRMADMRPAITDMQKGIAILVDRQKFTDATNAQRRPDEHSS